MSLARRVQARKAAGKAFDFALAAELRGAAAPEQATDEVSGAASAASTAPAGPFRPSLATKKRLRHLAAQLAPANDNAPAAPEVGPRGEGYAQVMIQLDADRRQLKAIQSVEAKVEAKRGMFGSYDAWIDGVLAADKAVQDEVALTVMVWAIDVGDYNWALHIAEWALRHKLALPERFKRPLATYVAEEIAEAAIAGFKLDRDFDAEQLCRSVALTAGFDMPDEVRAKQHKAVGLMFVRAADSPTEAQLQTAGFAQQARQRALIELRRATELNPKAGVVKDIERLDRELKKETME